MNSYPDDIFYADDYHGTVDETVRARGSVSFSDDVTVIGDVDIDSGPFGHIELSDDVDVRDTTMLRGNVAVYGSAMLSGHTIVIGPPDGRVDISGDARIVDGRIYRSWEYACFSHQGTWGDVWEKPITVHRANGGWNVNRGNMTVGFSERLERLTASWLNADLVTKPWEPQIVRGLVSYIRHHRDRALRSPRG